MIDKRDFLFRFVPQAVRTNLQLDEEALYSTTDQVTGRKICDELSKYVNSNATIVDGTACIGGLTYTLTNAFRRVIAIELDARRFGYLRNNMELLNVASAVCCIQGDVLSVAKNVDASAIILDPPWGGPEYKNLDSVRLQLGNQDISHACAILLENNPRVNIIAIKVPINFDETYFKDIIEQKGHTIVHKARLRKMALIVVSR